MENGIRNKIILSGNRSGFRIILKITPGVIMYGGRVICVVEGSSSGGFYHFL
jgi:hypothetical protein